MAHEILIHGKRLDPGDAARALLPSDTLLVCPRCESRMVQALEAKLTERFADEAVAAVPRMQDRQCLDCGFRWATVLPPAFQAAQQPGTVPGLTITYIPKAR